MARIPSYGQIISGQCGFNQATSHPADPITRHRARRERSHPKVVLTAQTNAVALDLLENGIRQKRKLLPAVSKPPATAVRRQRNIKLTKNVTRFRRQDRLLCICRSDR